MRYLIIILAIIFSLSEETSFPDFSSSAMQISDALPVQFWLTGCATYNEHQAPGIHNRCFCAPWECQDDIKIQFKDDPSMNYSLDIYDSNQQLLETIPIDEIQDGVYELTINLSEDSPDVCDQIIQLKIRLNAGTQGVTLPDLDEWVSTQQNVGDIPWILSSNPSISVPTGSNDSELLEVDYPFIPGLEYTMTLNYTVSSGGSFNQYDVLILDNALNTIFITDLELTDGIGSHTTAPLTFVANSSCTKIGFIVYATGIGDVELSVTSAQATRQFGSDSIVAKTDCLDVRENHDQSILIAYSNHRNFAGLVYENNSPATEFMLRVPAIFYHQRFPEEDEVMELTDELVTLTGTVRKQKQLYTDYVPYYFHEKLKLILKHQNITINGTQWLKQESYDIAEGNRQHPLKRAVCWLSQKDFVHRNIL